MKDGTTRVVVKLSQLIFGTTGKAFFPLAEMITPVTRHVTPAFTRHDLALSEDEPACFPRQKAGK